MKTKSIIAKRSQAFRDDPEPKKPQRRRAAEGDPIVARKMVGIRASLHRSIREYQKRTPVDETAAIHQLVLYGHRYGGNIEAMLSDRAARLGKSRAGVIEDILMEYYQRVEAERAAALSSARVEEKVARLIEGVKADVKPPAHEPPHR